MIDIGTTREILRMREKGASISRISRELNISRPTVLRYLKDDGDSSKNHLHEGQPIPKKKAAFVLNHTSETHPIHPRVAEAKANADVIHYRVQEEKEKQELEKVIPQREHPLVVEKEARFKVKKLDLDEFKVDRELQALKQEEIKKTEIEKQAHLEKIAEAERVEREKERRERWEKWVQELQDWSLLRGISLPWGFSLSTKAKFEVRDAIKKALETRSENENGDEISKLIREISQATIQPYIDRFEEDKRIEKTKQEAAELERKEKEDAESKARVERIKKERERVEAEEKAFWDTVRERRKKEEIEELLQVGMNRFSWYLTIHRKELGKIDAKEQERGRRHLERELKEEVEGNETDEEIEKLTDEILNEHFFEEG